MSFFILRVCVFINFITQKQEKEEFRFFGFYSITLYQPLCFYTHYSFDFYT
jgi:hypothetical protein